MTRKSFDDEEWRIDDALADLQTQKRPNIAKTARHFSVSAKKLRNRAKGIPSKFNNTNATYALSEEQEYALEATLTRLDDSGFPPRLRLVRGIANSYLREAHGPDGTPPKVSKMWPIRWQKRHPEWFKGRSKTLAFDRKNAHDPDEISYWYERFAAIRAEKGIQDADIYNMDETGFRVGVGRSHHVLSRDRHRRIYIPDPDDRDYVTVVECISAVGKVIPPMVVLAAKTITERYHPPGLADDVLLGISETGYMNDELTLKWLRHFERTTKDTRVGSHRILIFDGYGSHLEYDFINYCEQHAIVPFCLLPHTSHLCQPLDVTVFQPYKHWHGEAVDTAVRNGLTVYTKVDFLAELAEMRNRTFKQSTIVNSFQDAGLVPFKPQIVLDKLTKGQRKAAAYDKEEEEHYNKDDNKEEDEDEHLVPNTPSRMNEFVNISNTLREYDFSSPIKAVVEAFVKGGLRELYVGTEAVNQLEQTFKASRASALRNSAPRRVVQKGGVIYV